MAGAGQFRIDEFDVEAGIVNHQRRIADKGEKLFHHRGEERLVAEKFVAEAMHPLGFDRHIAFGIEIGLEGFAGGEMIDQFDTADFHDAVAVARLEARGFGIEDNLTHQLDFLPGFPPGSFAPGRERDPSPCR